MCRSVPQIAVFSTRISTSLGPGTGTGTCSIHRPFAASRLTSAFMVADIADAVRGKGVHYRLQEKRTPRRGGAARRRGIQSGAPFRWNRCMRLSLPSLSAAVLLAALPLAHAAEGMWVPQQLPELAGPLKKAG